LRAAGFFVRWLEASPDEPATPGRNPGKENPSMANHLTPEELSKELGLDRQEVIRVCVEEGVPIYQGKIDKYLFSMTQQQTAQQHQPAA
jgi:hypothetical protein